MRIKSVNDKEFRAYGAVLEGFDFAELLQSLRDRTERPSDSVIYRAGDALLESLPIAAQLRDRVYGGLPIQLGYCNGSNHMLNCLEYHRGSEVNIAADDAVLLLARLTDIDGGVLDTGRVVAFELPAGKAALLYETTLHYAPCNAAGAEGFRVAIVLPRGTNLEKPSIAPGSPEDKMLWAANKWLLAHPEAPEAAQGAYVGLVGENTAV